MKTEEIITSYTVATFSELSDDDRRLVTLAREATHRSYAPYSHFCVGAAIALDNGETVTGANQENVAYPSGICAERTAAFYAHAAYPEAHFLTIAIPIAPCGACRQALLEYELLAGHDVRVILTGRDRLYILPSVHSLLPFAFTDF